MSRQIKDFEETLGTPLFDRNKKMELTAAGLLLKDRAQEIVELVNKATDEFDSQKKELFSGKISFGCIEGSGSDIFSELVATFHEKYPHLTYNVFTGTGDDISDRIDQGNIDFGILLEPIHLYKYNSIRFNNPESWGVLIHQDHPLANFEFIDPGDLIEEPLFIPGREAIIQRGSKWFGKDREELNAVAYYKLMSNISLLVEKKVGIAIGTKSASLHYQSECTKFIPFKSIEKSHSLLAWKKDRLLSPTVEKFIEHSEQLLIEI